jgi:hypothetical protein
LPINCLPLVQACLAAARAIEGVEAQFADRILVWTFIPGPGENRVLARCREPARRLPPSANLPRHGGCTG